MNLGVTPDKPHKKSVITGGCYGKYHPHGDSPFIGSLLVRMAMVGVIAATLVDGHGNFVLWDGDGAAAQLHVCVSLRYE